MKINKIFLPLLGMLLLAAVPAFSNNNCCPEEDNPGTEQAIRPLKTVQPTSVNSLHSTADAVVFRDITNNAFLHPAEMLIGRVPGLWVTGGYNFYQIRIRGAMGPPLLVLDGMQLYSSNDQEFNNTLWSIPVTDIDRIEVLKSAATAGIYGGRGANGVIVIHTRPAPEEE